jgi:hypothetical protein
VKLLVLDFGEHYQVEAAKHTAWTGLLHIKAGMYFDFFCLCIGSQLLQRLGSWPSQAELRLIGGVLNL